VPANPVPVPRPSARPQIGSAFPVLPPINGHSAPAARSSNGTVTATVRSDGAAAKSSTSRKGRPMEETRRLANELLAKQPHATDDEIAGQLGITLRRYKTVMAGA
jgi:hypothetical protein